MAKKLFIPLILLGLVSSDCAKNCLDLYLGDGVCQNECNNYDCTYDKNDCLMNCLCDVSLLGDGNCNQECYNLECLWDYEDCRECLNSGCNENNLSNRICDSICNNEICEYDGGDCALINQCSQTGCPIDYLGNGDCDNLCNISSCEYDKGDCVEEEEEDSSSDTSGVLTRKERTVVIILCILIPFMIFSIVATIIRYIRRRRGRFDDSKYEPDRTPTNQAPSSNVVIIPPSNMSMNAQYIYKPPTNQPIEVISIEQLVFSTEIPLLPVIDLTNSRREPISQRSHPSNRQMGKGDSKDSSSDSSLDSPIESLQINQTFDLEDSSIVPNKV